jgi:asparagine synthase (glutamine-hydrolysing)
MEKLRNTVRGRSVAPVYQDGTSHLRPGCISPELMKPGADNVPLFPKPFKSHLSNALYRDLRHTKLPRVLRMNDRLSMAFSRELREPFLDHRIVEYLFRIPGQQKIRGGKGKYLLRHAMREHLPDSTRLASKRGVVTPQREWIRRTLRGHIEEMINSREFADRGLFDVEVVKREFSLFCSGSGSNAFFIWQWINAELWFRQLQNWSGNEMRGKSKSESVSVQ